MNKSFKQTPVRKNDQWSNFNENPNKSDPDREYKVYIPSTHQLVPVSKEFYYEYYRPIWRTQKVAQKHGQCMCPKSKLWCCDGCCLDCSYHAPGNVWSLEYEQELMGNKHEDPSADVESIVTDKIVLERLFKRLDQLFPEARRIGELRMEGVSDRDIADIVGIPRSTFRSRLEKLKPYSVRSMATSSNKKMFFIFRPNGSFLFQ